MRVISEFDFETLAWISQTGSYLSSFYKYALDKNITGVHFEAKQWILHTLRSLKCKYFSLGLSLSLVYETGA